MVPTLLVSLIFLIACSLAGEAHDVKVVMHRGAAASGVPTPSAALPQVGLSG